jgi:hypothetical protein
MTKDEFISLSLDDQESFVNSGGMISPSIAQVDGEEQVGAVSCVSQQLEVALSSNQPVFTSIDGILIKDPVDLLYLVDDEIQRGKKNGGVDLEQWQIQIMLDFAHSCHTHQNPFKAVVRACNGSGKDKYVIAACAVWVCMRYRNTVCPVTSASGFQLKTQTCKHTKRLCEAVNRHFGVEFWDIIERTYTMRFDPNSREFDSQIVCYATDEPGKAEGFHPIKKNARMAIFLSEDKTIPDEINDAINKCTGYTHRVHASTPGKSYGHFHDYCKMAIARKAIKSIKEVEPGDWIEYHVTSDMCPHLGGEAYKTQCAKDIPGGRNSDAYKSQVDAEFGDGDSEGVCIPYTYVWQACRNTFKTPWYAEEFNTAGVDLSDGGAETALAVRNGNKLLKLDPFKFNNQGDRVRYLDEKFKEHSLDHPRARIYGDSCGAGKPDLDRLKEMGWINIRMIDSRNTAYNPSVYKNRNAEVWFHMRRLFEIHAIILFLDQVLEKQLASRHYKLMEGKIHQMLSKQEERRLGHPSPDRADAVNLCFWGYKSPLAIEEITDEDRPFKPEKETEDNSRSIFTLRSWSEGQRYKVPLRDKISDIDDIREELRQANFRRLNK